MKDIRITLSVYKVEKWRSGNFQVLNKTCEFYYPLGEHRVFLDNTNNAADQYIIYMSYNPNTTQVSLRNKSKIFTDLDATNLTFEYPYGNRLMLKDVFTMINVKDVNNDVVEGFNRPNNSNFNMLLLIAFFVCLYLIR
jgi:hypothetical protein